MKSFYPPHYDKVNRCMQKLPKIQRFNEKVSDTVSVCGKDDIRSRINEN